MMLPVYRKNIPQEPVTNAEWSTQLACHDNYTTTVTYMLLPVPHCNRRLKIRTVVLQQLAVARHAWCSGATHGHT